LINFIEFFTTFLPHRKDRNVRKKKKLSEYLSKNSPKKLSFLSSLCGKENLILMIAILQRVSEASVKIEGQIKGEIDVGFMVLLGITHTDTHEDVEWLAKKIVGMRIFSDEERKMNLDLEAVGGNILLISQFTLHASTKKGNRPSFIEAARPEIAIPLYEKMIVQLEILLGKSIQTGEFGADMKVSLVNDGPVTIVIDSKNRI
jgi:D-aminoacyl-tRNA deacylase